MAEHRRYMDEPYALELVAIERLQGELRVLADHALSPLPQRLRSRFARMFIHLTEIRRELQNHPDRVSIERGEEDDRGETALNTP